MVSQSLLRRLARLEAALNPGPEQGFTVLIEPDSGATDREWLSHHKGIAVAFARGDRIGVVRSPGNSCDEESGVEYFENEIEAGIAVLASQKSQQGRANRLADVLAFLKGNVLGVVADPVDCEEEA